MTKQKLILFGTSQFAEIALEYFTDYTDYEVVAFSVPREFKDTDTLYGLPVVDFEEAEELFPPETHKGFVAIAGSKMNRNRMKMFNEAQFKGYDLISFIHPRAFVASSAKLGRNVFLFEGNNVQSFVEIGDNTIVWSTCHLGHSSKIGKNNFFTSHVVVSGNCKIGNNGFFGVNSTINDGLSIGNDVFVGSGSLVVKNLPDHSFTKGNATFVEKDINSLEKFGVK